MQEILEVCEIHGPGCIRMRSIVEDDENVLKAEFEVVTAPQIRNAVPEIELALRPADSRFRACEEIIEVNPASLIASFPRKRESRDFSRLPGAPAFAGATIWQPAPILSHALSRE